MEGGKEGWRDGSEGRLASELGVDTRGIPCANTIYRPLVIIWTFGYLDIWTCICRSALSSHWQWRYALNRLMLMLASVTASCTRLSLSPSQHLAAWSCENIVYELRC